MGDLLEPRIVFILSVITMSYLHIYRARLVMLLKHLSLVISVDPRVLQ